MYLAFDPGSKNFAVWSGTVSDNDEPLTSHLSKYELRKPVYESVIDLILSTPWMCEPTCIKEAVIETQAPRNTPARIAATAIYGVLRGKGVNVKFSGTAAKNKTINYYASKLRLPVLEKPAKDAPKRSVAMHRINKKNSVMVAKAILDDVGIAALDANPKKMDDLADATLLALSLNLEKKYKI